MLDRWTATDVLAHLRSCADVFLDVVPRIMAADRPRLEVVGPRDVARVGPYRELAFAASLRAFTLQRTTIVAMVRALRPRPARGARSSSSVDAVASAPWVSTWTGSHVTSKDTSRSSSASAPGAAPAARSVGAVDGSLIRD